MCGFHTCRQEQAKGPKYRGERKQESESGRIMSKSNADFSAFDFNDSSENSLNSRSIFLNRGGLGSVTNSGAGEGGGSINGGCSSSQATSEIGGNGGCGGDDGDDGDGDGDGDTNINGNNEGSNALDAVSAAIGSTSNGAGTSAAGTGTNNGGGNSVGGGGGGASCSDVLVNNFNDVRSGSASLSNNSAATTGGLGGGGGSAGDGSGNGSNSKKYRHQNYSKNIYIGTKNAEKWELTRTRLAFKNDVEFVAYLLNLAENDTERSSSLPSISSTTKNFPNFKLESNLTVKDFSNSQTENCNDPLPLTKPAPKLKKRVQFHDPLNGFSKTKDFPNFSMKVPKHDAQDKAISSSLDNDVVPEVLDCRIAEKIKSELAEKSANIQNDSFKGALCLKKSTAETYQIFNHSDAEDDDDFDDDDDNDEEETGILNPADKNFRIRDRSKIKKPSKISLFNGKIKTEQQQQQPQPQNDSELQSDDDYDDDGDDGDDGDGDEGMLATEIKNEQNFIEEDDEHNDGGYGIRSCRECTVMHDYEHCPLRNSVCYIKDTVDLSTWIERKNIEALEKLKTDSQRLEGDGTDANELDEDNCSQTSDDVRRTTLTFAEASMPSEFELRNIDANTFGVFAKSDIPLLTKLGPIIGKPVQVNDIPDDSNMKTIFEICEGDRKSDLISCDDPNTSNWLRFIRPALSYEERTANLVSLDRQAYLVTCRELKAGFELLYWSDDCNTMWRKKHTEKINCGGCNLKFEHPLFYRTHCSVFHDPSFSLTIRKYHCKVCGEAVLGKDNIMKHAAEMHEGKGAYQCQFCNKFFLRLNYLEMHRTYGCSANPQRARPLCDFCGRKFCQPQKLKVHIKRMHSGSRAALQRHSKEVHSRNSAVVSCPRCQKLFQNRSNLKIHMLTHSGVRPFKCAESECTAAFTTKQCLQFHYKKVHNYSQEQMPKIERSVAYTFDAYSGGMKVDFLEQAPRRRRKSLEDQNSLLSSSMLDSKSDTEFEDDLFESIKKSGKSIKDLCRNETNLSLLSSKINNIFTKEVGRKRKKKQRPLSPKEDTNGLNDEDERMEMVRRKQNAQLSLVETFLSKTAQRISEQQQASAAAVAAIVEGTDVAEKLHMATGNSDISGDHENSFRQHDHMVNASQTPTYKHSPSHAMMQRQNLVVSKGSKKWISNDDRHMSRDCPSTSGVGIASPYVSGNQGNNIGMGVPPGGVDDPSKLLPNRDFLARLMGSSNSDHHNHPIAHEEDENSSFLDVVDSNNPGAVNAGQMNQFHHNGVGSEASHQQQMQHMNSIAHSQSFMNSFYNNSNARLTSGGGGAPSSASMLVEAALNSVGSIMDNDSGEMKSQVNSNLDNGNQMNSQIEVESDRFGGGNMSNMDNLENEIKLMKNLNNFPMQIPPLPMYPASGNSLNSCNISPDTSTPTDPQSNQNNNDIDVDAGSTPRGQHMGGGGGGGDSESFSNHHQTPPSPQAISPGRDYSIFGSNDNAGNGGGPSISASSPLPSMQQRRNASSVGASGGSVYTDHELISPASSPSIPRYNFSGNDICRKRDDDGERPHNMSGHNQLSSDDENSILPQNSGQDMRMKFTQSQMDLVYSKYESMASAANLKYGNNQDLEVPSDYRNSSSNDLSDLQGLDMTSRSNVGSNYHHNFQLPPGGSNLGLGRYHHHIYDILSEREQQQQQQQQQQHHHQQQQEEHSSQLSMQQHQSMHNHNLLPEQLSDQDHDQTTSVDLSRTANYVVSSPPQIPYNHPHHDVLRMVSLDLTPNGNMGVGNNRSFLPSQIQHNNRDSIDHHRLLSTAEQHRILAASNADQHRLLVDPTAHLLMEQNNRLLSSDQSRLLGESAVAQNRHMAAARGFGAYHQVASGNYHPSVRPVLPSPNHHASNPSNYHPFPAYY
ncbi:uncharacterized protein LOC129910994 isoform X2 [Episyrphus balteatus]|uniref:uncharacterized protein LOC129910994 isoform X2 n=1 Tax=Episyrphus balteatus TaxID=286459 RepID=UPI0024864E4C|nr:uncharacterized protein LOC129910994 isoform X2 [Episyrphus balteatus]